MKTKPNKNLFFNSPLQATNQNIQLGDHLVLELVEVGLGVAAVPLVPEALDQLRAVELGLHHVEENRHRRGLSQLRVGYQCHLENGPDERRDEEDLPAAQADPHAVYLLGGVAPHVAVALDDALALGLGEGLELEGRLGQEGYGAVEEVGPGLLLEVGVEELAYRRGEEAEGLEDHAVLEHYHLAPVGGEDAVGDEVLEDLEDLHEEVEEVELRAEVLDVDLVVLLGHLPAAGKICGC